MKNKLIEIYQELNRIVNLVIFMKVRKNKVYKNKINQNYYYCGDFFSFYRFYMYVLRIC